MWAKFSYQPKRKDCNQSVWLLFWGKRTSSKCTTTAWLSVPSAFILCFLLGLEQGVVCCVNHLFILFYYQEVLNIKKHCCLSWLWTTLLKPLMGSEWGQEFSGSLFHPSLAGTSSASASLHPLLGYCPFLVTQKLHSQTPSTWGGVLLSHISWHLWDKDFFVAESCVGVSGTALANLNSKIIFLCCGCLLIESLL